MRITTILIPFTILTLSGCVCIPSESVSTPIARGELAQHVRFLTQPALKGRAAGSWESARVRTYLSQQLQRYGCVPWASSPSFVQDFKFGKNIVAVLPGSDPEPANEVVLVSAHYDHIPPKWFTSYPGACDNAAAVAVLLEIAEHISLLPARPKRSICFAFFDAEEKGCLGAFNFTCRDDYDDSRIAAVINIDLLGRDLLDVVDNCLIVTGTEHYPALQQQVAAACDENKLKCVPLQADLIDPVGDHVAFTSTDRPVLFVSCGINKDYHQPTDTMDKINFDKLTREAAAVKDTVLALADGRADLLARSVQPVARQKDDSLFYILDKFKQHQDTFGLDPNQVRTLDEIIAQARDIDPARITPAELLDLERRSLEKLLGLLENYSKPLHTYGSAFLQMSELYALDPKSFSDAYRRVIRHYRQSGIPLLKQHAYSDRFILPVTHRNWGVNRLDDGRFIFAFIDTELAMEVRPSLLTGITFDYVVRANITACRGELDRIVDLVLFSKKGDPNTLDCEFYAAAGGNYGFRKPAPPTTAAELAERKMKMASLMIRAIEDRFPDEIDRPSMARLHDPNAFIPDPNDSLSIASLVFLVHRDKDSKKLSRPLDEKELTDHINNPSVPSETRVMYIRNLANLKTRSALAALADFIDTPTRFKPQDYVIADATFPLRFHPFIRQYRLYHEENQQKYKGKTLGQIALDQLKDVTQQDFGTDKAAWHKWIDRHYK